MCFPSISRTPQNTQPGHTSTSAASNAHPPASRNGQRLDAFKSVLHAWEFDSQRRHGEARFAANGILVTAFEKNATTLNLSNLGLTTLPPNIGDLDGVKTLRLGGNRLVALPASIDRLPLDCSVEPASILSLPRTVDGKAPHPPAAGNSGRPPRHDTSEPPRPKRPRLGSIAAGGRSGDNAGTRNERTSLIPLGEAFTSDEIVNSLLSGMRVTRGNVTVTLEYAAIDIRIAEGRASRKVRFTLSDDRRHILPIRHFDPGLLAPLVRSGLVRRTIFVPRQEPVLSDEIKRTIVNDVTRRFGSSNFSRCLKAFDHDGALLPEHLILGLFLDSLWTIAYGREISNTTVLPSDHEIDLLFHDVVESLIQQPLSAWSRNGLDPLRYTTFEPAIKETFHVLENEFERVPLLQNIARQHRWRLLVDRRTVDLLETLGISSENCLMAFVFNTDPGYAELLAKGWVCALEATKKPLTAETSVHIHRVATGGQLCKQGDEVFGVESTPDGLLRIGENMRKIAEHGLETMLQYEGWTLLQYENTGMLYKGNILDRLEVESVTLGKPELQAAWGHDLLHRIKRIPLGHAKFRRREALYGRSAHRLMTAMNAFMKPVRALIDRVESSKAGGERPDTDEIREVICSVYLQEEMLHAMEDGNYRLWGLLEKNRWYAMAGEGLTLVYSPNLSDGASVSEAAAMDKEGQQFMARLTKDYEAKVNSDPHFFDMSRLQDLAIDGPTDALRDAVAAARLYSTRSPSQDRVHELILFALKNNAPLERQIILTELPNFDAEGAPDVLDAAAKVGAKDFCAHLYATGADPDSLDSEAGIQPEILKLTQAARTIRRFADGLANLRGDPSMFMALRAHDMDEVSRLLEQHPFPSSDAGNDLAVFQEFLKQGSLFRAIGLYAVRREEVLRSALELDQGGGLKAALTGAYALHHLKPTLGLRLALHFLEELEIDPDSKLESLLATDAAGECVLHKVVKGSDESGFRHILDFIHALEIPARRKLDAVLATDKEGRSALDYLLGDSGARMARAAREWIDKLPESEESNELRRELQAQLRRRTSPDAMPRE